MKIHSIPASHAVAGSSHAADQSLCTNRGGSGMSFQGLWALIPMKGHHQAGRTITIIKHTTNFIRAMAIDNEKRKKDPYMPARRSKGEKARNSRQRSCG